MRLALADGLINADTAVFDYGCGHGADLRYLEDLGIGCAGWDPVFAPTTAPREADIVNLGYVINVIEEPNERLHVLKEAWRLARRLLIVAARLSLEAELPASPSCFGGREGR